MKAILMPGEDQFGNGIDLFISQHSFLLKLTELNQDIAGGIVFQNNGNPVLNNQTGNF